MRKIWIVWMTLLVVKVSANEGMWLPTLLESIYEDELKPAGLKLSPEQIYSVNQSSLKDAVVLFGGGCTGEVISNQGLLLTNHHCGYWYIQNQSTEEQNYLKNGFWAYKKEEELPSNGLSVTFLRKIENVTEQLMKGLPVDVSWKKRQKLLRERIIKRTEKAKKESGMGAFIRAFDQGNAFYLMYIEKYEDIRLVGAPPSSIGKFGGDTDNWMWPRHTGDFSMFRIYANPQNKPAKFDANNKPYAPKKHLKISMKGVEDNDFVMVYGFPGKTEQHLTSSAVDFKVNRLNPARIGYREKVLKQMDSVMALSAKDKLNYASKQARISNAYKKWIGESRGLKELETLKEKSMMEYEFDSKLAKSRELQQKYMDLPHRINRIEKKIAKNELSRLMYNEFLYYGSDIVGMTRGVFKLLLDKEGGAASVSNESVKKYSNQLDAFYDKRNMALDRELFSIGIKSLLMNISKEELPWGKSLSLEDVLKIYDESILIQPKSFKKLLKKASKREKIISDPLIQLIIEVNKKVIELSLPSIDLVRKDSLMNLYVQAKKEVYPKKKSWYDANQTLRLAFGNVKDASLHDGSTSKFYSTLEEAIKKYVPGDKEFDLPAKLVELEKNKDYGEYAQNGELRICFISTAHTTGGNSGSPALDANGDLIGLNFDRSWESTMSDVQYSSEKCRNIMVDIRYILFIIDKMAGAQNLIDEMDIQKN